MTISSEVRKAGPYVGNDVSTSFSFAFKVFSSGDVIVVLTNPSEEESILVEGDDYTVTLNDNQDTSPGGSIEKSSALADGYLLTVTSGMENLQPVEITNLGGFYPSVLNSALDRMTILIQQVSEQVDRAVKTPISSGLTPDELLASIVESDSEAAESAAAAAISANNASGFADDAETSALAAAASAITAAAEVGALAVSSGAALVGFLPSNTGASASTVQTKLHEVNSIQDFWRTGDGSDYSAALQRAMDSDAYVIDGQGRTYEFNTNIVSTKAKRLANMTLAPQGTTTSQPAVKFQGSAGTSITPSADIVAGATSFTTTSPESFVDDQWVFFKSNQNFSTTTKCGELARVKSISGGTVSLYAPLALGYAAADTFTVTPITMLPGVILDNVKCSGDASVDNLSAFWFEMCDGVVLNNPVSEDCDYGHVVFDRCARFRVNGGTGDRTGTNEGLDYGIVVTRGCYDGRVFGYSGTDMRHAMTIGGSEGVSRFIYGIGCHADGALDAGFDCHPSAIEHGYINCTVNMSPDAAENEGIISQGAQFLATGNVVRGVHQHGVMWQPRNSLASLRLTGKIVGNDATGSAGDIAFLATTDSSAAPVEDVVIDGNTSYGFDYLAQVYAAATNVEHATVTSNKGKNCLAKGVYLRADAGLEISSGVVHGNNAVLSGGGALEQIYLQGVSTGRVKNVAIGANNGSGGTIGLRLANTDNCTTDGTNTLTAATKFSIDAGSTGVLIREYLDPATVTNSTYTMPANVKNVTVNRAGTVTITFPSAASWIGRQVRIRTIQAQLVVSASSNVVPITDTTAGTAILPATDGAWALLESDGTNWIVMQRGS